MNVATYCDGTFLETVLDNDCALQALGRSSPPVARLTPLEALLEPRRRMVRTISCRVSRTLWAHPIAKS